MFHLSRSTWPRWARILSSPWLVSPVLLVALVAGAFLGYGAYTRSTPTHYGRGGEAFVFPDSATPSPSGVQARPPAGAKATPKSKGRRATTPGGSTSGGRVAGARTVANSGQRAGGSSSGGGSASTSSGGTSGASTPRVGSYTLSVSGSENVKFGPFAACNNTFPSQAQLSIQRASGEPGGSYDFDLRYYPGSPNKHDERHIYRYTSSAVLLSYEQATVTCGGVKQSTTVSFSPPQEKVALPLRVGASWSVSGGDNGRTEKGSSQVVGTTSLPYHGVSYTIYVIDTHISMSGDESGTRDQRWWYSPDLGLPLRWHESLSGQRSGATYSEDVTVSVVGGP